MSTTLDRDVRLALDTRKGDWQAVADGSGVSHSWISKFMNGHIRNPGFNTLKLLFDHLQAKPAHARKAKADAAQ